MQSLITSGRCWHGNSYQATILSLQPGCGGHTDGVCSQTKVMLEWTLTLVNQDRPSKTLIVCKRSSICDWATTKPLASTMQQVNTLIVQLEPAKTPTLLIYNPKAAIQSLASTFL